MKKPFEIKSWRHKANSIGITPSNCAKYLEGILSQDVKKLGACLIHSSFTPFTLFKSLVLVKFNTSVVLLDSSQMEVACWLWPTKQKRQNLSTLKLSWNPAKLCAPRLSVQTQNSFIPKFSKASAPYSSMNFRSFNNGSKYLSYPNFLTSILFPNAANWIEVRLALKFAGKRQSNKLLFNGSSLTYPKDCKLHIHQCKELKWCLFLCQCKHYTV